MDSISKINTQSNFNQLLNWFLSPKSMYVEKEEPWNIEILAKNICHSYINLPVLNSNLSEVLIKVPELSISDYPQEDKLFLKPIDSLKSLAKGEINEFVFDFLIHGSYATLDYSKGWSDLDTYVIINSDTLNNYKKLIKFRNKIIDSYKYLLAIDPHQHHGFIFCSEFSLNQYFSYLLPKEVLMECKSLINFSEINLKYNRDTEHTKMFFKNKNNLLLNAYESKILKHHAYEGEYLKEDYENSNAMYQLKYFLSIVMTLPTYYLDAIGKSCYKRNSFDLVKDKFINEWEIIDKASIIRDDWNNREKHPIKDNIIPNWVKETLGGNYFYRAHRLSNKMISSINNNKN
tara:strand:+ start:2305 stop:3342 length:1038 start_codon:yes stop_codon:yes gene_type:complete